MDSDTDADLARAIALSMEDAERATGKAHLTLPATTTKPKSTKATAKTKTTEKRTQNGGKPEVFVISSDEEDLVPKPRAVRAKPKSKATSTNANLKSTQPVKDLEKETAMPPAPTPPAAGAGAGPLSLLVDRAQMERERLARAKRVRGPSPPPPPRSRSPGSSDYEDEDEGGGGEDAEGGGESGSEGSARKRARLDKGGGKADTLGGGAGKNAGKGKGKDSSGDGERRTFPEGALLRVDTQHADASIPTSTSCIRLSELLGPRAELAFAVLSAFVVDASWLYGFFEPETPVVLVGDAGTSGGGQEGGHVHLPDADGPHSPTLKNIFPNWVRVCPPLPLANNGRGCMHMKFMLLFGKDGGLRVVVGSANLVPHDWRDVENYLFVQDLPPASPATGPTVRRRPAEREKPSESFPAMFTRALRAVGVEEALGIMRRQGHTSLPLLTLLPSALLKSKSHKPSPLETNWDWRRVRAALVPSVPGRWEGWAGEGAVVWTAQPRLLRAVLALGCGLEDVGGGASKAKGAKGKAKAKGGAKWELELDCLTSSIGTYTPPWIAAFRLCAAGRATGLQTWLDRGRKKTPAQGPTRILFPTLETVQGTVLGEGGAGTVFCRRAQWTKIASLVADEKTGLEMRDARSRSGLVGMHTKMILGTLRGPPDAETDPEATESDSETDDDDDSSVVEVVEEDDEKGKPHAWLYVGSHNFTPSAWGTLNGSAFNPVLNVTNYELGVVLRLETAADAAAAVAWERPARRYVRGDVPWIQEESAFFMP
ncbi:hypothetical protein B0H19DRAFT_1240713 [Mycena capillaripes]|nr:hypothetical protein B0H19DRAFT_1240713 [Mycena capillaripes]